jgi:hypothetical protein
MSSICEQMDAAKRSQGVYVLGRGITRAALVNLMNLTTVFLLVIAGQAAVLPAQALLAGLAISGSEAALGAHMAVGGTSLLISAVQVAAALLLRRSARIPRWLIAVSIGFSVADAAQMAAGRLQLFALHLPLGGALFGASIGLAIYSW